MFVYWSKSLQMLIFLRSPVMWPFQINAIKTLLHLIHLKYTYTQTPTLCPSPIILGGEQLKTDPPKTDTCTERQVNIWLLIQTQNKVKRDTICGDRWFFLSQSMP